MLLVALFSPHRHTPLRAHCPLHSILQSRKDFICSQCPREFKGGKGVKEWKTTFHFPLRPANETLKRDTEEDGVRKKSSKRDWAAVRRLSKFFQSLLPEFPTAAAIENNQWFDLNDRRPLVSPEQRRLFGKSIYSRLGGLGFAHDAATTSARLILSDSEERQRRRSGI